MRDDDYDYGITIANPYPVGSSERERRTRMDRENLESHFRHLRDCELADVREQLRIVTLERDELRKELA